MPVVTSKELQFLRRAHYSRRSLARKRSLLENADKGPIVLEKTFW